MKHRAWLKQMEIRFRSAMPQWFRQAYRIVKSAGAQRQSAELRADVMDDCRFVRDRYEILRLLPKGGTVAEIGTETGDFARQIVKLNQPAALHLVDINFSKFDADGLPQASVTRVFLLSRLQRITRNGPRTWP